MGRPISMNIPHNLGRDEARRRIDEGFGRMSQQMSGGIGGMVAFTQHWQNDRLNFEANSLGQKLTGRLDVLPDSVHLEVDLPEFLAMIADRIKARLASETQKLLLEKK
jgi:Putative polyhydroxyalkanoic acid system protein (PHA_gran_rgn)